MKNSTRTSLYPLLPEQIPTNGSAKKRNPGLGKKMLLGGFIALGLGGAAWGFAQYQTMQAKGEFLEYAVAHKVPLNLALLEWGKIQYLKTHATLPAPPVIPAQTYLPTYEPLNRYNEQFLK
jgi:hypothetical protein